MSEPAENRTSTEHSSEDGPFRRGHRLWLAGFCVAGLAFARLFASALGIFADRGFGASLLNDPAAATNVIKLSVVALPIGLSATIFARRIRPDAGLFVAAVSLLAIRRLGGATGDVYLVAPTAGTLVRLAIESAIVGGLLAGIAYFAGRFRADSLAADDAADGVHVEAADDGSRWTATAITAVTVAIVMWILCRSDDPWQVTASAAIAGIAGGVAAVRLVPGTPAWHVWIAPMLLSIVAYALSSIRVPADLAIGDPGGWSGPLLRALPLDYASAGVAGALYGFWIGRPMIPESQRLPLPASQLNSAGSGSTPSATAAQI